MPPVSRAACLTKLDGTGAVVWNRAYQIDERSQGMAVRRATDDPSHFVLLGHSDTLVGANQKVFLMKTDAAGTPIWSMTYGASPGRQFAKKMELRSLGAEGYIACGTVDDGFMGRMGFLLRVDETGGLLWMRFYPVAGAAFNLCAFNDVQETAEGFVVTGYAPSQFPPGPVQNSSDTIILTTDAIGNPIWAKQYANLEGSQGGESITRHFQGYAVVGGHLPTMLDSYTTELFSVDASGTLQWYDRIFGGLDGGSHFKNQQLANGTLRALVSGDLVFVGGDFSDAALFRFDALGNHLVSQSYGVANPQWGTSYVIEPTGEFTLVGPTSTGVDLDYYVVRADAAFSSGCNERDLPLVIDHPPIEVVDIEFVPLNVDEAQSWPPTDIPLTWIETTLCSSSPCLDPFTATCTLASGDVTIDWAPALPGVSLVEVRRNGVLQTTLPGTATSYTDPSPLFGTNTYEVKLVPTDPTCEPVTASCSKYVRLIAVLEMVTDVIFRPARPISGPFVECWADHLQTRGRQPRVISTFEEIVPELADAIPCAIPVVWLSLGEFPDQYELTPEDGDILATFLESGGSLYVEGGDVGFAPPTALSSLDGAIATADGAPDGDVPALTGLESGLGLDLSSLSADYTGSGRSIDHLAPDGPGAAAIFRNAGGEQQTTAVFYDATSSGAGNHRVVTSSTTLKGYAGDPTLVIDAYLAALAPPEEDPTFIRGECNGDGNSDIADGIFTLSLLFSGGPTGPCAAACDANGDGSIDVGDAIFTFSYLLLGGSPPPAPFPDCGPDPAAPAALECEESPNCP